MKKAFDKTPREAYSLGMQTMTFQFRVECLVLDQLLRGTSKLYLCAHTMRALSSLEARGLIRRSGISWIIA